MLFCGGKTRTTPRSAGDHDAVGNGGEHTPSRDLGESCVSFPLPFLPCETSVLLLDTQTLLCYKVIYFFTAFEFQSFVTAPIGKFVAVSLDKVHGIYLYNSIF